MDPIPLNAVQADVADVAADADGTAVAAPVADIAGAAADARAALAGAATDARAALAGAAADARAALAGAMADTAVAAADVAAVADSAGDLYCRACRVRRHCGLHAPRSARSSRHLWL